MNFKYKRVMITGPCGSGKSTFARKLGEITGLPVIHLDKHYHQPGWTEPDLQSWILRAETLAAQEQWIMDGNYSDTMPIRLKRADLVINFDHPIWLCLWRVIQRVRKYNGQVRPDMAPDCPERFDWEFIHFVATWKMLRKERNLKLINKYLIGEMINLNNDKEVSNYLKQLKK